MDKQTTEKLEDLCNLREILTATTIGAISFPLSIGFMQNFVFKPFRISCKLPNAIVSLFGGTAVLTSGILASQIFILSLEAIRKTSVRSNADKPSPKQLRAPFYYNSTADSLFIYGGGSLLVFKIFGGKYRNVVPSHLFYPGAFAEVSVRAPGKKYARKAERRKLNILGKRYGCHSCGKRWPKMFIGDHMPPNKVVKFYQKQVFYPHCKQCSINQGSALISSKPRVIQTHGTTLRMHHLWLPIPLGIAILKNVLEENNPNNSKNR